MNIFKILVNNNLESTIWLMCNEKQRRVISMSNLTSKELSAIEDQLNYEQILIKSIGLLETSAMIPH